MNNQELNLTMLRLAPKLNNQTKLSNELKISVGKVKYILKSLIKIENFAIHKNKKQYNYLLTAKGIEEKIVLTKKFIKRNKNEYEQLQREQAYIYLAVELMILKRFNNLKNLVFKEFDYVYNL